jgi:hypothetical protein
VKDGGGKVHAEGSLPATHMDLGHWMKTLPQPWNAAMEATMFTGWIYVASPVEPRPQKTAWHLQWLKEVIS